MNGPDIEEARRLLREADTADSFGTLDADGWEDLGRRLAKALQLDDARVAEKMPWALWGYAIGAREDREED
ncbi:hypothetical protein PV963_22690 [Streptomyces coeruleorubidus]|jgi:hypothetical protein|uniref:hypothetical protein n=1 Tax=Streptomyces coeruleorubidus TaxID=116188 RepID=UPI00237FA73F|nr:hypothetical protein [Streptomyces coeruleorubidus]WDV52968.1 hypothetical protein PV963_22690 [Streptomyces coeruleorubidus]